MEPHLAILTPKQRRVYLLRQEGLTFKVIGEKMGTTSGRASFQMREIERRFREYDRFQQTEAWNKREIIVTMTQGELRALLDGLSRQRKPAYSRRVPKPEKRLCHLVRRERWTGPRK